MSDELSIPGDIKEALERYAAKEKKRMGRKNPVIADMITWKSLAQHILRNEVQKRGYYAGKVKKG
jgi:hypothetical protein